MIYYNYIYNYIIYIYIYIYIDFQLLHDEFLSYYIQLLTFFKLTYYNYNIIALMILFLCFFLIHAGCINLCYMHNIYIMIIYIIYNN